MRISTRGGRLRLRLETVEAQLLLSLLDELDDLLAAPPGTDDDVLRRLFPDGYRGDDAAAAEFRTLTEQALRSDRGDRVRACRADLAASRDVDLADADAARRWIQVLNDLRLALGTRLGITADDDHAFDPTDPEAQPRAIYGWLTVTQDGVVDAVMGRTAR